MSRKKMHVRNEKTIREVYDEFILDCRARNLSSYTIRHYETQMAVFLEFHDGENDVTTLTAALFQKYVLYCQKKEITSTTVQTYTKVIRTFYHYCMKNKRMPDIYGLDTERIIRMHEDSGINILRHINTLIRTPGAISDRLKKLRCIPVRRE